MPAMTGASETIEVGPRAMLFHKYGLYPGEEASLWVTDLGQASKEGFVVDGVVSRPPVSEPG